MTDGRIGYESIASEEATTAARTWWDANASEYLHENGAFLGPSDFVWGPEGLREAQAQLLGPTGTLVGKRVLEVGAGASQCSRWLARHGAHPVATDISYSMLAAGNSIDDAHGVRVPAIQADARALPFADQTFDLAFTSFGAIPFVPDANRIHSEIFRLLKPGGRWVFSVTHPARWMFPDDPTMHGTTITRSYFARDPYVEFNGAGKAEYAEYHRTVGDHVRDLAAAGFRLANLVEPEWPAENTNVWGGWGPERGAYLPGTAIFVCDK